MMGKEHVLTKRSECIDADCRESGHHVASKFQQVSMMKNRNYNLIH